MPPAPPERVCGCILWGPGGSLKAEGLGDGCASGVPVTRAGHRPCRHPHAAREAATGAGAQRVHAAPHKEYRNGGTAPTKLSRAPARGVRSAFGGGFGVCDDTSWATRICHAG